MGHRKASLGLAYRRWQQSHALDAGILRAGNQYIVDNHWRCHAAVQCRRCGFTIHATDGWMCG